MEKDEIVRRKEEIVARYGPWTAHDIDLGHGIRTLGFDYEADKLARIVQIVADLAGEPLDRLRVLDLGCRAGGATRSSSPGAAPRSWRSSGARANLGKARFAKEVLGLDRLELVLGDVRELAVERVGRFDAVLCSGLLYHLDAPDCFEFVHRMAELTTRLLVIDTYVGIGALQRFEHRGRTYWGRPIREHEPDAPEEERLADLWASLDNPRSVWLARTSLLNLLADAGFSSTFTCEMPFEPDKPADRATLVAIRGERQRLFAMPEANDGLAAMRLPPFERRLPSRKQRLAFVLEERLTRLVPKPARRLAKQLLGRA